MPEDGREISVVLTEKDFAALNDAISILGGNPQDQAITDGSIRHAIKFWTYVIMERRVRGCTFLIFNKDTKETSYLQMGFDTDVERQADREAVNILTAPLSVPEPAPVPPVVEAKEEVSWFWKWPTPLLWVNAAMFFMGGGMFLLLIQITMFLMFGKK